MYAFDRNLTDPVAVDRLLRTASEAGIDTLVTKAAAVSPDLADRCHRAGLRVYGSLACFSDHASSLRRDDLRPVDEHGRWASMEWYTGLVPTDPAYNLELARQATAVASHVDGLLLDFLRWPLHWELELRPGATPRHTSFDPRSLAAFAGDSGHPVPSAPREAAGLLLGALSSEWYAWRERVITDVAALLTSAVRRARPDIPIGMFLVPANAAERRLVGQDVTGLSAYADMFFVMSYHGILRQPPDWVTEVVADLRARTDRPVVPMIQTTADPALARGADWGEPVNEAAFAKALALVDRPVCLFPAEGMDDRRWLHVAATDRGAHNDR